MLVLSRHKDEDVRLERGGVVLATIKVVRISGDTVRLGLSADKDIDIHRPERKAKTRAKPAEEKG
jgi:carbon storage regulator CsrA